jgi:hypothetical protein
MKKAWIENGVIRDICPGDPDELYRPEVAELYNTDVPDEAENGDAWVDGALVKRPAAPETAPESISHQAQRSTVSPVEFKLLFTPQERVAIKSARASDPVIEDFMEIVEDPRLTYVDLNLRSTQDALGYLVAKGILTEDRKAQIIEGTLQ